MVTLARSAMLVCALGLFSCGSKMPYLITPPASHPVDTSGELTGAFTTSDNRVQNLSSATDLPTLIIFGQDTCASCGHEADAFRASLRDSTKPPTQVHLFTLLVGAIAEDASDWKDLHQVPWTVGADTDASLFKHFCTGPTVPCEIVYVPGKGIVLRQTGPATLDTILALTGPWEK